MKNFIILLVCILFVSNANSQTIIKEGKIIYDIFVTSDSTEQQGQLIITIKNNILKREMKMNNGFKNVVIFNANTGESKLFNNINGMLLTKTLSKQEVEKQNLKFKNATYDYTKQEKIIADIKSTKVNIEYADGNKNDVYVTNDYKMAVVEFYNMFPELQGFPMQYQVTSVKNNIVLKINKINLIPIEQQEIDEPKGYKQMK